MSTPYLLLRSKTLPLRGIVHVTRLRLSLLLVFACALSFIIVLHASGYLTVIFPKGSLPSIRMFSALRTARIARIQKIAYDMSNGQRPVCSWNTWHAERYGRLENSGKLFLAMNLHNNEDVLPTFFQELPHLLQHLGPDHVYVSIYENGSGDRTPQMLNLLSELLEVLGTPHRVIADGSWKQSDKESGNRINFLAAVRNTAMQPLYSGEAGEALGGVFDEVIWINDVFHCTADILEILYQKRLQGAHQACATDWGVWGDWVIYDRWVLRPMSGRVMYRHDEINDWFQGGYSAEEKIAHLPHLLPEDPDDRARIERWFPLQVFSCWNGATVFDAASFLPPNNIRFRVSHADLDANGVSKDVTEKASECFLSSVDLWKHGLGKILLVPKASVAYSYGDYETHRKDGALSKKHNGSEELVEWVVDPPKEVAMQDFANWWGPERWAPWDEQ
ncbi:cryptococcal mannosyltransferase 1-domain-containing protein [Vararia minispora EC-137]|uniref:Cryptococcal mannosyltransferase 1-domain-containing protein n=1 Tax=Vararia minispora EC-137 TaxID=1314806 RepID=A0ACB8QRA6_9AGAM|nr:cryptococcal mannosyltransferase 1-domain-containing protein [Vararia minispora EC-137]